ncbi:hypothetical protein ACFPJ1_28520 [Kribbella qitaiheensis]|uniref:hypothetical protein n=1 Tax=Kribbella qitaiheensis TaxID=1544730 RepID=UPI0036185A03
MTEQTTQQNYRAAGEQAGAPSGVATGFIVFAGVMMIMSGAFQAIAGLVALPGRPRTRHRRVTYGR